ncbi:MAG: NAD-dependent epimerase/dehydratase family protein [Elusimicrobia bacterium]|nr:NAD-dependent epimerase/dehydratase family protein [Elusimicrobiota bacterium]
MKNEKFPAKAGSRQKRKKILVTGGAGFIASNISDAYIQAGYSVVVVDNLSTGKKENINPKAKFYEADITDKKQIAQIFEREKPDIVNHHAAQIDVRKSLADPIFDAQTNIIGTINLLENCVRYKIKKFIFASSGGVMYGECGKVLPSEKQIPRPISPYGITKHAVEHYLDYYSQTYRLKYVAFRYGNVYGPRQDPYGEAGVVAIFCNRILANEPINIFGDGEQMRDYVFVSDIVNANLIALKKGKNEIFNIGTGGTKSVNQLFYELKKITGYSQKPVYRPPRTGELFKSSLDVKKAQQKLGWSAKMKFSEGLEKTFGYFRASEFERRHRKTPDKIIRGQAPKRHRKRFCELL